MQSSDPPAIVVLIQLRPNPARPESGPLPAQVRLQSTVMVILFR
jgi:hypothetical protein